MDKEKTKNIMENMVNCPDDYSLIEDDFLDNELLDIHPNVVEAENDIFFEIISSKSDGINSINEEEKLNILESLKEIREMLSEQQNMKLDRVLQMMNMQET